LHPNSTWETTKQVDAKGHFILRKHVIVSFGLDGLKDLELNCFRLQNVVFPLSVQRSESGLQLLLDPCYGIAGALAAEAVGVECEPGKPEGNESRIVIPAPR
jgi:hypothetical protein